MASSITTGSIYGSALYGTATYGQVNVAITVDGVSSTANSGAITIVADANTQISSSLIGYIITDAPGVVGDEVVITADSNTLVTGVSATGAVTTVDVAHNARPTFSGVAATGSLNGSLTFITENFIDVTGVEANFSIDSTQLALFAEANVASPSVSATGAVTTVTTKTVNYIPVTGVSDTVTIDAGFIVNHNARPSVIYDGLMTSAIGSVSVTGDANTAVSGTSATGSINDTLSITGYANIGLNGISASIVPGDIAGVITTRNPIQPSDRDFDRVAFVTPEISRIVYVQAA